MKYQKKFIALQVESNTINKDILATLKIGEITGPYYDETRPEEQFETEEEAIKWAFKENEYASWLILPFIKFDRPF